VEDTGSSWPAVRQFGTFDETSFGEAAASRVATAVAKLSSVPLWLRAVVVAAVIAAASGITLEYVSPSPAPPKVPAAATLRSSPGGAGYLPPEGGSTLVAFW
jgi:hypothetical protein